MKYVRPGAISTATCAGCGDGIMAQAVLRAIDELELNIDDFVFVSGIGCAGWIPSPFFNADTLHTTHGRPIAFASGVKLARPDRKVVVISGDGPEDNHHPLRECGKSLRSLRSGRGSGSLLCGPVDHLSRPRAHSISQEGSDKEGILIY